MSWVSNGQSGLVALPHTREAIFDMFNRTAVTLCSNYNEYAALERGAKAASVLAVNKEEFHQSAETLKPNH
jgi:hypothetical protein